uniref:GON-4 protein n=1 Tax=Daphnia magna TaxID=35525 RepID=A0A0P4XQK3_9CRUS
MASKETEQVLEEELQALHHSIEQLNSVNSEVIFQNNSFENQKTSKKKRVNQADVQTQTPKKSRKSSNRIPEDYLADPDNPIDEILEEIAQRKNLTTYNVKHLLRNIIANESVQEMLKCSLDPSLKMDFQPKLTRSKTKEWLETQNRGWPTSAKKVSETQILMEEDFPEDSSDEDDEYRPNEDDIDNHSDEGSFLSSHTSDIGSPSSSLAPFPKSVSESTDPFKRPFPIEQPPMHDDLIGSRTRSKLPLNDTLLEHLELAFVPPDISTDMYDSDCDNEEWRTFLKEFVCPPSNHFYENLDDEDADPEYNVLEEEEEVDAEELRADRTVQITKKEVSELLSELFEADFSSSDEENTKRSTEPVRVREPADDILQTAMSDIMVQLETNSPSTSKTPAKPTGIVQPLVPIPIREPVQDFPFTVSFPTLDCAPIEMFPQIDPVNGPTEVSSTLILSPEATLLLNEQMRKHVQLLTQMHLITAQQSGLESITEECRFMLQDLVSLKQRVDIANLDEALDLVNYWESVVTKVPPEELTKFQRTVITCGERKKFFKRSSKHPDRYPFNPKMVELMAESRIFLYPELLPKIAIFQSVPGPCKMSLYEEQLIAMGMEQFTPFCADLLKGSKSSVDNLVNSMISHYMLPHWTAKQIGIRIKNKSFNCKRTKNDSNPIKYYLKNKVAPPVNHVIQPFDRYSSIPLCDVPSSMLPVRWRELMLIHKGIRLRSRKDPFALRSLVPKCQSSYYLLYENTPTPESAVAKPTPATKKPKPRRYSRTRTNKKKADCKIPQANSERQASQALVQSFHSPIHCNLAESEHSSSSYLDEDSYDQSPEMLQVRRKGAFPENRKRKKKLNHTTVNSSTDNVLSEPIVVAQKVTESINQERNNIHSTISKTPPEIYPIPEQLNLSKADNSLQEGHIEKSQCNGNSVVSPQPTVMSSMSSYHQDSIETDPESEPQHPLDASSPHIEKRRTSPTTNQGAKRYFIIHRPDSNTTHVMHVWGPSKIRTETSVPLRTVADREASNTVGGPNTSSQGNQKSTSSCNSGTGNFSSFGQNVSGTGTGNSGGDDGERPPSSPLNIRHVDENVVMEDDDDEEDSISFDFLASVPLLTHSVPSKGRSPAHRHIRHQRNAKRILDSWMADDDPSQPRSDAYAQIYFMKVRNRLEQQNPLAFKEFVTTLGHFQSSSCSTLELYRKMESILKDHLDLMEEFVLFLSPEAAAQCGVQFQHFLYVRMREFFSKLKIHFKDSPLQLKRTLKTLQQIESSPSPNVSDIKNALLPLLKGNAHLTQAFLQLFLDDAPLPSDAGDFEDVNMDQINSGDEFEHVHLREATTQSKENEAKSGKRTGMKGSAKNKSKGKSWKKSS